ncbi:hypothetical protein BGZ76_009537 [Entomortierella beljakovae]|nr:hypothetical protein BGZ76_009537 [Entomortierella beljakovae]
MAIIASEEDSSNDGFESKPEALNILPSDTFESILLSRQAPSSQFSNSEELNTLSKDSSHATTSRPGSCSINSSNLSPQWYSNLEMSNAPDMSQCAQSLPDLEMADTSDMKYMASPSEEATLCNRNPPRDEIHEHSALFPNGNQDYTVTHKVDNNGKLKDYNVGWAMLTYGHTGGKDGHRSYFKSCLGIYHCPISGCQCHVRPKTPRNSKKKYGPPPPTNETCPIHNIPLVHRSCNCTLVINLKPKENDFERKVQYIHCGTHSHVKPRILRLDSSSKALIV